MLFVRILAQSNVKKSVWNLYNICRILHTITHHDVLLRTNSLGLTKRLDSNINPVTNGIGTFELARRNTIKTFLLISICFVICWSNNEVYYFMYNLGYKANWNGTYFKFTLLMVFLNCTVNPFIYLVKYEDYQRALKNLFGCCSKDNFRRRSESSVSSVNTNECYI